MDDRFSDDELRELLRAVIATIRDVPVDDPGLVADVEHAVQRRPRRT